eukprot:677301-Rhodomonas_salina.2
MGVRATRCLVPSVRARLRLLLASRKPRMALADMAYGADCRSACGIDTAYGVCGASGASRRDQR